MGHNFFCASDLCIAASGLQIFVPRAEYNLGLSMLQVAKCLIFRKPWTFTEQGEKFSGNFPVR
jgi:hypothetical protein